MRARYVKLLARIAAALREDAALAYDLETFLRARSETRLLQVPLRARRVSAKAWRRFIEIIKNPPPPSPELVEIAREYAKRHPPE